MLLAERAVAAGATRIAAQYRPTAKNGMVRDLLDRLGFALVAEDAAGVRDYRLTVSEAAEVALPMRIERGAWPASPFRPPDFSRGARKRVAPPPP